MVNDKIEKHRWWCCGIIFALLCFSLCGFGSLYLFAMHGKKQTAQRCFFSEIRCAERNYGIFFLIKKEKTRMFYVPLCQFCVYMRILIRVKYQKRRSINFTLADSFFTSPSPSMNTPLVIYLKEYLLPRRGMHGRN